MVLPPTTALLSVGARDLFKLSALLDWTQQDVRDAGATISSASSLAQLQTA